MPKSKNRRPTLKLYVWENVLTDYTEGIMFALAESPEQARELIAPGYAERRAQRSDIGRSMQDLDLDEEPRCVTEPEGFAVWGGG